MNVLLISQCDKRALVEPRRVLDQFAERRGNRTWLTPMTQAGLDTLRKLLRKTARKNTAVACHWIRGKDHSELLWIVGDRRRFNEQGAVPTHTTQTDILRRADENHWHRLQDIKLLADLAGLLHDLGKACVAFQLRLKNSTERKDSPANLYRHEWISLRLFQAFVGSDTTDQEWLMRLADPDALNLANWTHTERLHVDEPFKPQPGVLSGLPPLAQAVAWLVLTHHRLPETPPNERFKIRHLEALLKRVSSDWNAFIDPERKEQTADELKRWREYWTFSGGLPVTSVKWLRRAAKIASAFLARPMQLLELPWIEDPQLMHLARLCLIWADHHYSALPPGSNQRVSGEKGYPLWANTHRDRESGKSDYKQRLDEHLLGVAKRASAYGQSLPDLAGSLPRLQGHRGLKQRSKDARFQWQNQATDMAVRMRERAQTQGAFIVNMASTGCGKTLANAKIMNGLAEPSEGMRCAFALGLRTLTLQTGRNYREQLSLDEDRLAIRVGGSANRALFEYFEALAEESGSASSQSLFPEDPDAGLLFEGASDHPLLPTGADPRDVSVRQLLMAPVLVCTVDHLTPATECVRGGRQIAPMLRLLSGDLVLDELDDFGLEDLPALARLMHWAGLLGSRVLLSSATLPPALVQGMFDAYSSGRRHFQRNCAERPDEPLQVCCGWVDEFGCSIADCADAEVFGRQHREFAVNRSKHLAAEPPRRRARIEALALHGVQREALPKGFAEQALRHMLSQHEAHRQPDPHSTKQVSFGLLRMANISRIVEVAQALFQLPMPAGVHLHLCVYHARFPLIVRSTLEHRLDRVLNRKHPDAVFNQPEVRAALDAHDEKDHLFVVLGSPVTEVGRDHDYDWAVLEPSSMRSIIQLAGRGRRHRAACGADADPNLVLLSHNLRCFRNPGKAAYLRPGFEADTDSGAFRLRSHDLRKLIRPEEIEPVDSRSRIVAPEPLTPELRLVDLEHERLRQLMLEDDEQEGARWFWTNPKLHLTAQMQRRQPFRKQITPDLKLAFLPDEDEELLSLHRVRDAREMNRRAASGDMYLDWASYGHAVELVPARSISTWLEVDWMQALRDYAEEKELPLRRCAERVATVDAPTSSTGWWVHPALGITPKK